MVLCCFPAHNKRGGNKRIMARALLTKNKIKANGLQFKKSMVIMWAMVKKNIKNQYRRSVLGILWTVLNPLLTMLVMAFVFSKIFGRGVINMDYPVYVLSGNIVFSFMRTATTLALPCMVHNYDLLTKTRVPYFVFPASNVMAQPYGRATWGTIGRHSVAKLLQDWECRRQASHGGLRTSAASLRVTRRNRNSGNC